MPTDRKNPKKEEIFSGLPDDVSKDVMFSFFSTQEMAALSQTSVDNKKLSEEELNVRKLLKHVVKGEQDLAEAMLQKNPDLLLKKSNVVDDSGRHFKSVTAFQYASWALDRHMWQMLLKYFPKTELGISEALQQLQDLEENKIEYQIAVFNSETKDQKSEAKMETKKESHFDFEPLIQALTNYANYHVAMANWSYQVAKNLWMMIGSAQREIPMHVVNEYCRKDRSFSSVPDFSENILPREMKLYNDENFYSNELGRIWAIFRGEGDFAAAIDFEDAGPVGEVVIREIQSIEALARVRKNEFRLLKKELEYLVVNKKEGHAP